MNTSRGDRVGSRRHGKGENDNQTALVPMKYSRVWALQVELHSYPSPFSGSLVLFDVTKLEHPIPVALRSGDRLLELLQHLRVRREVLAPLSVDRSETFADQV